MRLGFAKKPGRNGYANSASTVPRTGSRSPGVCSSLFVHRDGYCPKIAPVASSPQRRTKYCVNIIFISDARRTGLAAQCRFFCCNQVSTNRNELSICGARTMVRQWTTISQFSRVHAAVDKDSACKLMYRRSEEIVILQDQRSMEPTTPLRSHPSGSRSESAFLTWTRASQDASSVDHLHDKTTLGSDMVHRTSATGNLVARRV